MKIALRPLLLFAILVLAVPAAAQGTVLCRGKQVFDLSGGASGCLVETGTTSIRTTLTRDDGQGSRSSARRAALIHIVAFGTFDPRVSLATQRLRSVCQSFQDQALAEGGGTAVRSIVVRIDWPDAQVRAGDRNRTMVSADPVVQAASASRTCRTIRFFG